MKHARDDYNRIQDPEGKIPSDEPVFLIRGQDAVAPAALRAWADLNDVAGGDPEASVKTREHAKLMEFWHQTRTKKLADL